MSHFFGRLNRDRLNSFANSTKWLRINLVASYAPALPPIIH